MDWYSIKFYEFEIMNGKASALVTGFGKLFDTLEKIDGLALYRNNHIDAIYSYYYLSIPENFPIDPKKLFESYRIATTFPPDTMLLEQLVGKESNTEEI